ncbi:hypothetical protein [Photobacterium damselae]|uniref:hypothetical protein n=1 Tax=Photobacterium damselae TaxID=38293 RepID=UPI001F26E892|nr:hypothetical protein [Photobacterium damselae]UKA04971.1 hypothetical protein IHC89_22255 [Photobacterium damselae subsp. damselae]
MQARDISPDYEFDYKSAKLIKKILKRSEDGNGIQAFVECKKKLNDYSYWFVLGTLWVDSTDGANISLWKSLFSSSRPNRDSSLMKPSELRFFKKLPAEITVYRAKRKAEEDWIAYTLDPSVAGKMAISRATDVVHEYKVKKRDVDAIFLRRGESEVLVLDNLKPTLVRTIDVKIKGEIGYVEVL